MSLHPGQRYYRCSGNSNQALELSYSGGFSCPNNVSVTNSESITTTYHCRTKRSQFDHKPKYVPECLGYFNKDKQYNNSTVDRNSNTSCRMRTAQRLKVGTRMR